MMKLNIFIKSLLVFIFGFLGIVGAKASTCDKYITTSLSSDLHDKVTDSLVLECLKEATNRGVLARVLLYFSPTKTEEVALASFQNRAEKLTYLKTINDRKYNNITKYGQQLKDNGLKFEANTSDYYLGLSAALIKGDVRTMERLAVVADITEIAVDLTPSEFPDGRLTVNNCIFE